MKLSNRLGLAVWMKNFKEVRSLKRLGNIHFVSKRLKYVYLYVDGRSSEKIIKRIERLPSVVKVERSQRSQICFDFRKKLETSSM